MHNAKTCTQRKRETMIQTFTFAHAGVKQESVGDSGKSFVASFSTTVCMESAKELTPDESPVCIVTVNE